MSTFKCRICKNRCFCFFNCSLSYIHAFGLCESHALEAYGTTPSRFLFQLAIEKSGDMC